MQTFIDAHDSVENVIDVNHRIAAAKHALETFLSSTFDKKNQKCRENEEKTQTIRHFRFQFSSLHNFFPS